MYKVVNKACIKNWLIEIRKICAFKQFFLQLLNINSKRLNFAKNKKTRKVSPQKCLFSASKISGAMLPYFCRRSVKIHSQINGHIYEWMNEIPGGSLPQADLKMLNHKMFFLNKLIWWLIFKMVSRFLQFYYFALN